MATLTHASATKGRSSAESRSLSARAVRRVLRDPRALAGLGVVLLLVFTALFAPWLAPRDPIAQDLMVMLEGPGPGHWLGTDELGRDILSRLIHGTRISLYVGVVAVAIQLFAGTFLGLVAGYFGGKLDGLIMRMMDIILAFPSLLLALAIAFALGKNLTNAMLAIGIVGIPGFARLVRGQVLTVRERDFIQAARALGGKDRRIIWKHILPNTAPPLIVQVSLSLAFAVLTEASLSFLGLGAAPPAPSWGSMLSMARGYMDSAPWLALAPGAAIFILVLGFNLLGDGIRDAFDPTMKG
jgi:peptide/nickel transport system permease protein